MGIKKKRSGSISSYLRKNSIYLTKSCAKKNGARGRPTSHSKLLARSGGSNRLASLVGSDVVIHPPLPALDSAAPAGGRRHFVDYECEKATYGRLKPELLIYARGKYVVLVGEQLAGPVDTFGEALRVGYQRFGLGPLFVKQVLAVEPAAETSRDL